MFVSFAAKSYECRQCNYCVLFIRMYWCLTPQYLRFTVEIYKSFCQESLLALNDRINHIFIETASLFFQLLVRF